MDVERSLISKALAEGAAVDLIAKNIEAHHFSAESLQEAWEWIAWFVRKYGASPTLDAFRRRHRDFQLTLSDNTLEYLRDEFIRDTKRRKAIELGRDFRDAIDDPSRVNEIETVALEMAKALAEVVPGTEVSYFSDARLRIAEYDRRREEGDVTGILTGIKSFDALTNGLQGHELLVVLAFLGIGKSTLMQWIFYQGYLQGKTPLMISLEMTADALLRRFDVMATHVRYWAMKAMELDIGEREKWEQLAERADADRNERDIMIIDEKKGMTPEKILALTYRFKPDLVGLDYLQLMPTPRYMFQLPRHARVQEMSRQLKSNALLTQTPIVAAAQANREAGRTGEVTIDRVGESIAIGQDCDIMIGLQQDEDQFHDHEMEAKLLKNRDGKKTTTTLHWELDNMNIYEKTLAATVRDRLASGRRDG